MDDEVLDAEEIARRARACEVAVKVIADGKGDPTNLPLEPLAGMTNRNYLITLDGTRYVVRIPGAGTEEYVDRAADGQAAQLTDDVGVGARLVHYDVAAGIQITEFIEGSIDMRQPGVLDDPDAVRRAARAFHRLHTCGRQMMNRFEPKTVAQEYLDVLRAKNAELPEGYERVQEEAETIRALLNATCRDLVPCHNDPAPENLVDRGDRVFILDWEFAGNNDPYWDLGDFSVESDFTEEQDRIFLEAYVGREPTKAEFARMKMQKALVFLLWTLWGVLQHVNANPRPAYEFASYWDYAMNRFTRCQDIMNHDDFPAMMDAVRRSG